MTSLTRPVSEEEAREIKRFFKAFDPQTKTAIDTELVWGITDREGAVACLLSPDLAALPASLTEGATWGLPVGTIEEGQFHLDLQGATLLADHTEAQSVRVTEHASRLFLYGRDILGSSVTKYSYGLGVGDACIVRNPRGEALGLGLVIGSFKGNRSSVEAIHDLGAYLREQGG